MSSNQSAFSSNSEDKVLTPQSNHESNDTKTAMISMYRLTVITILAAFLLALTSWWAIAAIKSEVQKEMGKSFTSWREIPIVVLTSRNLSKADRARLSAYVETIVSKGDHGGIDAAIQAIQNILKGKVVSGVRRAPDLINNSLHEG
jgi:hypothetical protein